MTEPKRIQRKRVKGWRLPADAVYVGRPTRWGNPFAVTYCDAVHMSSRHWHVYAVDDGALWLSTHEAKRDAVADAINRFRMVMQVSERKADMVTSELAGKDLACWCPPDQPCHADVLLHLANGGDA